MPAMGTGLANEDGDASEALMTFYEIRAKGAGLIITEFTMINQENGRHNPWQLVVYSDDDIPGLRAMAKRVHKGWHQRCLSNCAIRGEPHLLVRQAESRFLHPAGERVRLSVSPVGR